MLLSLLGRPTDGKQARALFSANRRAVAYAGASLDDIATVLVGTGAIGPAEWIYFDRLCVERIAKYLRGRRRIVAVPSLLSFGIVHPVLKVRARHAAVLLSASSERIELLDPLAPAPADASAANTVVAAPRQVSGARYRIDGRATVALLRWRPPSG
jgi:hypothetical protein